MYVIMADGKPWYDFRWCGGHSQWNLSVCVKLATKLQDLGYEVWIKSRLWHMKS